MVIHDLSSQIFAAHKESTLRSVRNRAADFKGGFLHSRKSGCLQRLSALICRFSGAASEINHSLGRRKNTASTAGSTISEQGFACGRSDSARAPNGRRSSAGTLRPFRSAARHGVGPDRAYPTVCHSGFPLKQQGMGGVASATNLEQAAGRAPQGKRLRRVITTLDCRPPPPPDCRKRR